MSVLSYSEKLIQSLKDEGKEQFLMGDLENIIRDFSKMQYTTKLNEGMMPFGKYKFKKIKDVVKFDRYYLQWLIKQDMMNDKEDLKGEILKCL